VGSILVDVAPRRTARLWLPHQHGAWAMLALPILVGIAASRFVPSQLLLAAAAVGGYLASATLQAWLRARRRRSYVSSIVAYGAATAFFGIPLLMLEPRLVLAAIVVVPAGVLTVAAARPGTPREPARSFAQVAQASVLVPASMLLAGETSAWVLGAATAIAAAEMAGSVLAVRSVIRERDNVGFAVRSVGYHVVITLAAVVALPWAYAALGAALTARAAALPLARRRLASTGRGLRPVHVGLVEAVASIALVVVALAVPLTAGRP
jgi:YwiC-like protein